ncbi:MAG: hypothetical protein O2930_00705 [Acidobacteria bacterium]|nr:hypothetical protein [Acidobacteriota bacterium]
MRLWLGRVAASRMKRWTLALAALLVLAAVFVEVTIIPPRVTVRWQDDVSAGERAELEGRYRLESGRFIEGTTWRYELFDRSRENVRAIVTDPAVDDTGYIDRPTFEAPGWGIDVSVDRARFLIGSTPTQLIQPQSVLLFAIGLTLLWGAGIATYGGRRALGVAVLLTVAVGAYLVPLRQPIRMGDSGTYVDSRELFETYSGVRQIRFEAHLSHAILGRLDQAFGSTDQAPGQALDWLMRGATAWFVLSALAIGAIERWSAVVLRYLALALLAPSTLLYFGYRELGHLSLSIAAFPLILRGLQTGGRRLEAGSVLSGLGAALHGFGLLSLAGSGLAACAVRARAADRVRMILRFSVWGTAAYLGWVAVYLIVFNLPLVPGHSEAIPWRPWLTDEVTDRINVAILSITGGRDLLFSAWAVGVPLVVVAAGMWRERREEVRAALLYAVPSLIFLVLFWPIQGLGMEMDLVFAAFPAVYALAWVCAHDEKRTAIAAVLLVSAHVAFWRIVLGIDFLNSRL